MTDELHVAKRKLLDMTKKWQKAKEELNQAKLLLRPDDDDASNSHGRGPHRSRRPQTAVGHSRNTAHILVRSSSWATPRSFVGGGFNVSGNSNVFS